MPEVTEEDLAKRRVPAIITYLSPFRVIEKEDCSAPWSASIDQVNKGTWDYVALHEVVGGIDVGLTSPYHMLIARDGALALPPLPELRTDYVAVEYFNRYLAALLLGGVYCEAINLDGLELGSIIDWKYVRSHGDGASATNRFHKHIRYQSASPLESISLYRPRSIKFDILSSAMKIGLQSLERLEPMRGEYLLRGVTGLARRDWGSALANLWIVAEQLVEALWTREVVKPAQALDRNRSRKDQLNDSRAWTVATRIELLHQKGIFGLATLTLLSKARKSRNDLAHRGSHPSEGDVTACYEGIRSLISTVLGDTTLPLFKLNLADHALSASPFAPPKYEGSIEPEFWMAIPKLPGEEDLEKAAAKFFANRSQPI